MSLSYNLIKSAAKGAFEFSTDKGINYLIYLKHVEYYIENINIPILNKNTLELRFGAISKRKASNDIKVKNTVLKFITLFFSQNQDCVLFYVCDNKDKKQKSMERLFIKWFDESNDGTYVREYITFLDEKNEEQIISIIFKSNHPLRIEIIKEFYGNIPSSGIMAKDE